MTSPALDSKLPDVGTTIFTVMTRLAQDHGAINLSQGYPDFQPPDALVELLAKYAREGQNQYPPMTGIPKLREAIARKILSLYGARVDMDTELTVTSGATEALFVAVQAVVSAGDEVIVLDPAYDAYDPSVRLAGGRTVHVPMTADFRPDWDRVASAVTDRTRLIIVNTPHNPSGTVFTRDDLDALARIATRHDLLVLSDEVYEHMVFDSRRHKSLVGHEALRSRSFVVSSFGKTYHATGWKVAFCAAPPSLTAEFRKVHQFVTFTTHTPTQWALAEFMETCPEHYLELPDFYAAKRDLFLREMASSPFDMTPTEGTYFQLADYSRVSTMADTDFANFLTKEIGVAAIPVSVFYETPPDMRVVRFCFCKDDDTLNRAASKLRQLDHV